MSGIGKNNHNSKRFSAEASVASSQRNKEESYWLSKLSGELVKSNFPYDHVTTGKGLKESEKGEVQSRFSQEIAARLVKTCSGSDYGLYMILVAGLVALLHKYSYIGSSDIIVGAPIEKQEKEGEFINTVLALRNHVQENMSFKELLMQVKETVTGANEHLNYPMETLLYQLGWSYSPGDEFPLFSTVILLENIHDIKYILYLHPDMIFAFSRNAGDIEGVVRYNRLRYEKQTVERIMDHLSNLLGSVLFNVNLPLAGLEILSEEERRKLLVDFNNSSAAYPDDRTIHRLFAEQAARTPDHVALTGQIPNPKSQIPNEEEPFGQVLNAFGGTVSLTYKELNEQSDQWAALLSKKGVGPDHIVGIMAEPSLEAVIGILAILKAGGAYLPIDADYPEERIQYMLYDSRAKLLVTTQGLSEKLLIVSCQLSIINCQREIACSAQSNSPLERGASSTSFKKFGGGGVCLNLQPEENPSNLAYVIYTSGTTGRPKGVMIEHRGVVNYICWAIKKYVRNRKVNFPLHTPISFDLTVTSIFVPLLSGNAILVYRDEGKEILIETIIDKNRVGVIKLSPSHLKLVRDKKISGYSSVIKTFIVGGEELETGLALDIHKNFKGNIEIYNEYGPTETVVGSMIYKFNPAEVSGKSVPIGIPADNTQIYILDKKQNPLPPGVPGELCISGAGAARGYLNRPELTNKKFLRGVPDASRGSFFKKRPPGGRRQKTYRTGDLARWLLEGNIEFLGRIDHQVKIRGYRIELEEIECQLLKHTEIKEAIVSAAPQADSGNGEKYLCAYFVANSPGHSFTVRELREYLSRELPDYMIPAYFVKLENFPLTSNGKIDRSALPSPRGIALESGIEYVAPENETQEKLVEIWEEVLNLEKVGVTDNFFDIGGHSLNATQVISRIHEEWGVKVKLISLFQHPTIEGISKILTEILESAIQKEERVVDKVAEALKRLEQLSPGEAQKIINRKRQNN